ncbi:MAG: thiolase [Chloroflexi bacterium]|nr:thiolase [Chloroflexota bacterium]
MSLRGKTAIVGIHEYESRFAPTASVNQIKAECLREALEDAGLTKDDLDGVCTAGDGGSVMDLCEYLDVHPKYVDSTQTGGSSFVVHIAHAAAQIAEGRCSVVATMYGSMAKSTARAIGTGGGGLFAAFPEQFEGGVHGTTTVGSYAQTARRHMAEYGTTSEHLAAIAVSTRKWAAMNPFAVMRDPITVEDVMNSRMVSDPLHLLDCCLQTDGGGCVIITSAERARDLKKKPVYILGAGEAVGHHEAGLRDLTTMAAYRSGREAFQMAGVQHKDIKLAMVYDSFTITVLVTLENLGFCPKGEGGRFVSDGKIEPGGSLPLNTDGGGLSSNHPGMRGIFTMMEATRQVRGERGEAQVPNCDLAVAHGTGGGISARHGTGTLILSNRV